MDEHQIHRLDEFLPHLARLQPHLLDLLPAWEQPAPGVSLGEWVLDLPHKRLMEICSAWVLETLQHLRRNSPLSNVLLRGCLLLTGEFDLADAAAVAIGEVPPPGDPRREEIRTALSRAARLGVLIHLPADERYCVPFPVRLSFEGVDFLDPGERDALRRRLVNHFGAMAAEFVRDDQPIANRHWRFANMLAAWETAVDLTEEFGAIDASDWTVQEPVGPAVPEFVRRPLADLAEALGRAVVIRHTDSTPRLLEAGVAAARDLPNDAQMAQFLGLLGQYYLKRANFAAAIGAYRRWERLGRETGNKRWTVLALSAVAIVHRDEGSAHTALTEFLHASAVAREAGLLEQVVDTANCAARLMMAEKSYRRTVTLLEEILVHGAGPLLRLPAYAETLALLGGALRGVGRPEDARKRLLEANYLGESLPHRPAAAEASYEMGLLCMDRSDWTEAEEWLDRSLQVARELTDAAGTARATIALADAVYQRPDPGRARELLARALRSAQEARRYDLQGAIWHRRGRYALEREDDQEALASFQNQVLALRETTLAADAVDAHLRIGGILLRQESTLAAAASILRAQGISRAMRLSPEHPALAAMVVRMQETLTDDQLEYLISEVTEELEAGQLIKFSKLI